jgi:putative molybdopterin biosynthesis protein
MALFLKNIDLSEAREIIKNECSNINLKVEYIDTREALGRVTAEPIFSKISSPHFIASAMDGIATKFIYTLDADINRPVLLKNGQYEVVDTGDPIPEGFDCVIMVEDIQTTDEGVIIRKPAHPYQNIRPVGEDIPMGAMIIPSNHKIRAIDIASLLAGGVNKVPVFEKVRVGIIPTGDELVDVGTMPKRGELIDFNSWTFAALVKEWGGEPIRYDIVKDDFEKIKEVAHRAIDECHIVIVNAGSAKGRGDFAEDILSTLGELKFHGVSIKPGRPASFSMAEGKAIFGVPGYPVSAYFVMENIVKVGFDTVLKAKTEEKREVEAILTKKINSSLKNDEFVRVKLGKVKDKLIASPIGRGAGVTMSLTTADGVLVIDKNTEGLEAGEKVNVRLLRDIKDVDSTLVCIGSHDVVLDIISDMMNKRGFNLNSTHVGSMGGIMALKRGETHIAPVHLLDEKGEYNTSYLKRYLGDFALLKFIKRVQGFMVQKGNPLNIKGFEDLKRVRFVNRQKGSGTRMLLDYHLNKLSINSKEINGYEREEVTHLNVAAQVASGSADCGLGVLSAAQFMGLEFIPVCFEEYDIAVTRDMLCDERFKCFLEVVKSEEFKNKLYEIGGYEINSLDIIY